MPPKWSGEVGAPAGCEITVVLRHSEVVFRGVRRVQSRPWGNLWGMACIVHGRLPVRCRGWPVV
eukprot:15450388-Alexandrium_andersonii.AAC.1